MVGRNELLFRQEVFNRRNGCSSSQPGLGDKGVEGPHVRDIEQQHEIATESTRAKDGCQRADEIPYIVRWHVGEVTPAEPDRVRSIRSTSPKVVGARCCPQSACLSRTAQFSRPGYVQGRL